KGAEVEGEMGLRGQGGWKGVKKRGGKGARVWRVVAPLPRTIALRLGCHRLPTAGVHLPSAGREVWAASLAFFANSSHGCNFHGCISYTKTPDFTAGSFVTNALASDSSATAKTTAPPALSVRSPASVMEPFM